jgi:hypothetical protein
MGKVATSRAVLAVLAAGSVLAAVPSEAQTGGPFQYHSVTPCRVVDTRLAGGGGPLADGTTRTVSVQAACGIPSGAKAVSVNLTAIAPTGLGFMTLFPTGITRPVVSSLNYNAGENALGNGAIAVLAATNPDLSIFARVSGGGTVSMTLDVTGYFQ